MSTKRGQSPGSLANLKKGSQLCRHGWWSKGIQAVGVPTRSGCPLRLLGNCECDLPDDEQCPVMLQQFVNRVTELQQDGISKQAAELVARLELQSALGHYVMDRQGAFREQDNGGDLVQVHPVWTSVGVVDHSLERLYKIAGILRVADGQAPAWGELLQSVLTALANHPEARAEVATVLAQGALEAEVDDETS